MKHATLGFARLAQRCSPSWLHLARSYSPNRATQPLVSMESTERDAPAPMGLWGFANHTRTVTVMGTIVRLVAPTVPTGRGASDRMAAQSFAGHINSKNPDGAWWQEPLLKFLGGSNWLSNPANSPILRN